MPTTADLYPELPTWEDACRLLHRCYLDAAHHHGDTLLGRVYQELAAAADMATRHYHGTLDDMLRYFPQATGWTSIAAARVDLLLADRRRNGLVFIDDVATARR